jgi:uncharacterized protein DUF5681
MGRSERQAGMSGVRTAILSDRPRTGRVPMNYNLEIDDVGYGCPPMATRWKKGECGNPDRKYKRSAKNIQSIMAEIFESQLEISENSVTRRITFLEAILLKLYIKASSGDRKAFKVLMNYIKFFNHGRPVDEEIIVEYRDY